MNLSARAPGGPQPAGFVPYVYGAALGCPSRGRPEKVLAHLKNTALTQQEDGLGREVRGAVPGVQSRNGMPEAPGYVYRDIGRDTLTGGLDPRRLAAEAKAAVPAAARLPKPVRRASCPDCGAPKPDHLITCGKAVTRLPEPLPEPEPAPEVVPEPAPAAAPARRCRKCKYPVGSVGHRIACGGAP